MAEQKSASGALPVIAIERRKARRDISKPAQCRIISPPGAEKEECLPGASPRPRSDFTGECSESKDAVGGRRSGFNERRLRRSRGRIGGFAPKPPSTSGA